MPCSGHADINSASSAGARPLSANGREPAIYFYNAATATASAATAPPTLRPMRSAAPECVAAAELAELALVEAEVETVLAVVEVAVVVEFMVELE